MSPTQLLGDVPRLPPKSTLMAVGVKRQKCDWKTGQDEEKGENDMWTMKISREERGNKITFSIRGTTISGQCHRGHYAIMAPPVMLI